MTDTKTDDKNPAHTKPEKIPENDAPVVAEIGGRKGPDPTRYGDWEIGGKCVDF